MIFNKYQQIDSSNDGLNLNLDPLSDAYLSRKDLFIPLSAEIIDSFNQSWDWQRNSSGNVNKLDGLNLNLYPLSDASLSRKLTNHSVFSRQDYFNPAINKEIRVVLYIEQKEGTNICWFK